VKAVNNVIITLRVNEEIKKELDRLALEENRSLNNLITTILIKYLEQFKLNQNKKGADAKS
jgi:predicted HicB family RNase H-like nuclease